MANVEEKIQQHTDETVLNVTGELMQDQQMMGQHAAGQDTCAGDNCEKCKNIDAAIAEFERENRKEILTTALAPATTAKLKEAYDLLLALQQEVIQKQAQSIEKNKQIKVRVQLLTETGKVQIDQDEFSRSEASVMRYAEVLNQIILEVERERSFVEQLLSKEAGSPVKVWKKDSDNFEEFVLARVKFIKQYIKTVKKNVSVSFSRYCFGFNAQDQRISYIESLLRNAQLMQAQNKPANQ